MITIDEVKKIAFPEEFGVYNSEFYNTEVANYLDSNNIEWAAGISKLVIFLNDDEVVKIPFNGEFSEVEKYKNKEDENDIDGYILEEEFFPFEVVNDYCEVEYSIYQDAIAEGLDEFFTKIEYAGTTVTGKPLYKAERVVTYYSKLGNEIAKERTPSEDSENKAYKCDSSLPVSWIARAYEYYGEEKTNRLIEFIDDKKIYDFHYENVGFRKNGAPVLLDFSDYKENEW